MVEPIEAEIQLMTLDELAEAMKEHLPDAKIHALLGLRMVEATGERVVVEMPVTENAFNGTGNLHGGALATLVDVAAGSAAVLGGGFKPGLQSLVTADLHVRYLGRPIGDVVRATATVRKAGRQLIVVECEITDPQGRTIVVADFAAMLVPLREPLRVTEGARSTHPDL